MFLLDTNICIAYLKGDDPTLVDKFRQIECPHEIKLCSIVKSELLYGARKSKRVDENLRLLQRFFSKFESFAFDDSCVHHYGMIRAQLEKLGQSVGPNDLLIACIAIANDLTVISRNSGEFRRVPGLRLEEW